MNGSKGYVINVLFMGTTNENKHRNTCSRGTTRDPMTIAWMRVDMVVEPKPTRAESSRVCFSGRACEII